MLSPSSLLDFSSSSPFDVWFLFLLSLFSKSKSKFVDSVDFVDLVDSVEFRTNLEPDSDSDSDSDLL